MHNQAFERFRKEEEQAEQRRQEEAACRAAKDVADFERGKLAGKEWTLGRVTLQDLQGLRKVWKATTIHRDRVLESMMRHGDFEAEGWGFRAGFVEAALGVLDTHEAEKGKA